MDPIYATRFMYAPCSYRQRSIHVVSQFENEELCLSSLDLVRVACDIAELPQEKALNLRFSPHYLREQNNLESTI